MQRSIVICQNCVFSHFKQERGTQKLNADFFEQGPVNANFFA